MMPTNRSTKASPESDLTYKARSLLSSFGVSVNSTGESPAEPRLPFISTIGWLSKTFSLERPFLLLVVDVIFTAQLESQPHAHDELSSSSGLFLFTYTHTVVCSEQQGASVKHQSETQFSNKAPGSLDNSAPCGLQIWDLSRTNRQPHKRAESTP